MMVPESCLFLLCEFVEPMGCENYAEGRGAFRESREFNFYIYMYMYAKVVLKRKRK